MECPSAVKDDSELHGTDDSDTDQDEPSIHASARKKLKFR